ncbi:MAG: PQQ-binding-like beta-propeller repeat protein, partial [Lentisphaeria bacterium]|nr:PQQ-binding-like beta-propeller repeat protein [Lentisphaeria bacterium]
MNTRHGRLERSQSGSAWAMGAAVGMFLAAVAAVNAADALRTEWALPAAATGGLIVQVGCGDARLAEEPPAGESLLACLLDTDPTRVAAVRDAVAARGRTGPVTVDRFDGANLPFVDGLVDLLVVHEPFALTHGECVRVLAPGGVLLCRRGAGDLSGPGLTADPAGTTAAWRRQIKPFPAEMDEWTHFLHGADGHAMSQDRMVGPPYHTQWVGAPRHARSHVHLTTVNAMVAAGGRLFVIADVGPTALPEDLPGRWALIARNAFNGIELWRRPLSSWQPYYVKDRNSFPADLHRRLVAADGRVFVTLHIHGPLSALDPASGETMHTYAGTEKLEDMVYEDGILFVAMNEGGTEELDRRRMAYRHVEPTRKRLAAVDAASGEVLWQKNDTDTEALLPMTLAARDASLYFQNSRHVVCVSKATGEVRWRADRPSEYFRPGWSSPTLTALDGVVVSADRQSGPGQRVGKDQYAAGGFSTGDVVVFDAGTGARLWSAPCAEGCRTPTDVFSLEGRLWFGK